MPPRQVPDWFGSDSRNRPYLDVERDQGGALDNMVGRYAQRAFVIGLAGCVGVRNLDDAAHQDQRHAQDPEQGSP